MAKNNNKTIGAILAYCVPFKGKQGYRIVEFFVDTRYQNKGIGNKLLLRLELELRQHNYDFISLLTYKDTAIKLGTESAIIKEIINWFYFDKKYYKFNFN